MATALKIYTTDENNNAITKTVSNANPAASDYVLKNFSQKLVNLSDSTFRRVERVNTKDITNATDSGGGTVKTTPVVQSTCDFFSTDATTWQAFVNGIEATTGQLEIEFTMYDFQNSARNKSNASTFVVKISRLKELAAVSNYNAKTFFALVNSMLADDKTGERFMDLVFENGKIYGRVADGFDVSGYHSLNMSVTLYASNANASLVLQNIYDGATETSKTYFKPNEDYEIFLGYSDNN